MPKPCPEEFRQDVVRVAGNCGPGVTVEQVATDFGVHPMTLWKWMRRADIDDGAKPGVSSQENAELREARRRIKLLEQENEVLRQIRRGPPQDLVDGVLRPAHRVKPHHPE
ncbi:transposase [Streptomyces bambusae]|uniref:transposase n=1 Tax=Streptomyces bambusae TaxID=1550616 RepID=UPI001CFD8FAC|nr:transposase [Streptomyces bambusae]MCB5166970.1 transposase [Streptomyces bambusae]